MNVELLQRVKAEVLKEPRKMVMAVHIASASGCVAGDLELDKEPPCGTVGCIMGWGLVIDRQSKEELKPLEIKNELVREFFQWEMTAEAARVFGLSLQQMVDLGYPDPAWIAPEGVKISGWPPDLFKRLSRLKPQRLPYAKVVAEAIDRFIACDGDWSKEKPRV